jgi:predicted DNA-binding protein YlxM (UPF0122 family)
MQRIADKNLFAHQAVNCSHGFKNIRYKKKNFINYFNKPSFDQSNSCRNEFFQHIQKKPKFCEKLHKKETKKSRKNIR